MVAAMTIVFSKQLTDKEREKLFSGDEDSPGDPPGDSSEKVSSCLTALCSFCIVSFPMCQKS